MYQISDQQIDFIVSDIRARGVEMEGLQQNLLDHICCIIEQNLGENGDFEHFYHDTIKTFYKHKLWEIEEETLTLLTFKHYYAMKKIMILSGTYSACSLILGTIFKFMYWPGAAALIVSGMLVASFMFLPLLFTLKAKEQQGVKDRFVLAAGALAAMLVCLSFLFRVMHWPHSLDMFYVSAFIMLFLFMPVYFYFGFRNPATKMNTITATVLIVLGYCLMLSLVVSPKGLKLKSLRDTNAYLRSEQLVQRELQGLKQDSAAQREDLAENIIADCESLKAMILKSETGYEALPADFETKEVLIQDGNLDFSEDSKALEQMDELKRNVLAYNSQNTKNGNSHLLPVSLNLGLLDRKQEYALNALFDLNNMELFVLQNERELLVNR